jgi:DNA-binding LytR/AlgR family response regulator
VISIAVVEDDPATRALLGRYLDRYSQENNEPLALAEFTDGIQIAEAYRGDFDILLMDIDMPVLNGFVVAQEIRQMDPAVIIVFVTNMTQYAIRGYEVDALSYLLKPVPYVAFAREMARALARLRRRVHASLLLSTDDCLVRLAIADIVYIESVKHRLAVHTVAGDYSIAGPLKTMAAKLADKDFLQCNSGYLVNLHHVRSVRHGTSCHLSNGADLIISRPRKKEFLAALTDYVGGGHGQ